MDKTLDYMKWQRINELCANLIVYDRSFLRNNRSSQAVWASDIRENHDEIMQYVSFLKNEGKTERAETIESLVEKYREKPIGKEFDRNTGAIKSFFPSKIYLTFTLNTNNKLLKALGYAASAAIIGTLLYMVAETYKVANDVGNAYERSQSLEKVIQEMNREKAEKKAKEKKRESP